MSNIPIHPESVNFLVDMRYEWERTGTICASGTVFVIHVMSKLNVCVDCISFPLGGVIFNGDAVNFLLTTGAPCTRKCPVAPESNMEYWTSYFLFVVKKLRLIVGRLPRWFICTILGCAGILLTCSVRVWRGISFSYEHPLSLLLSTEVILLFSVLTVEHFLLVHTMSSLSSSSCSMGENFVCASYLWVGYRLLHTLTVVLTLQASSNDAAAPPCQAWLMPGFTGRFTLLISLMLT